MFSIVKQGDSFPLSFRYGNYKTGKTVTATPRNPSDVAQSNITLTESATQAGIYVNSINTTGMALGYWSYDIKEGSTVLETARLFIIDGSTMNDTPWEDMMTDIGTTLTAIQSGTYGLAATKTKLDSLAGGTFVESTDSNEAIRNYLTDTIYAAIQNISNNVTTRIMLNNVLTIPDTGSSAYDVILFVYNAEGGLEDPDDQDAGAEQAMVEITVVNQAGTDRSGNLSGLSASTQDSKDWMARDSLGRFSATYTVADSHATEELQFVFNFLENATAKSTGKTVRAEPPSAGTDYTSRFNTIDSNLATVDSVVDGIAATVDHVSSGNAALKVLIDSIIADLGNGTDGLGALKALIDTLQSTATTTDGKVDTLTTNLATTDGKVDTLTTNLATVDTNVDTLVTGQTTIIGGQAAGLVI